MYNCRQGLPICKSILCENRVHQQKTATKCPIRRSGTMALSSIPNEIYFHILGYLKPVDLDPWQWHDRAAKYLLLNVAAVCRLFFTILQPWVFESLRFDPKEKDLDIPVDFRTQSHVSFCRSVADGEPTALAMAQHVKKCVFNSFNLRDVKSQWCFERILSVYSAAMRRMPNIQELSFTKSPLTRELVKTVVSLRQLTGLKLEDCRLAEDVEEEDLQQFPFLKLKYIDLGFGHRGYVHSISLKDLAWTLRPIFCINVHLASHIATSYPMVLELLTRSSGNLSLESFEVRQMDLDELPERRLPCFGRC